MASARGCLGLVPAAAELGDMIAFLVGCELPMVLRRDHGTGNWKVVGPGWVYGLMDGELAGMMNDTDCKLEDIILC